MKSIGKIAAIKEFILGEIRPMAPGARIPSRAELMSKCGCSRASVDRAVEELTVDGYLFSRQGSGTFVCEPRASRQGIDRLAIIGNFRSQHGIWRFSASLDRLQRNFPCKLYDWRRVGVNLNRIVRGGTGVLWMYPRYQELMAMDHIAEFHIPQLLVFRTFDNYDCISTDAYSSIARGLGWLTGAAGKSVALITSTADTKHPYIAERKLCFYELAIRHGITVPPEWIFCDHPRGIPPRAEMMRKIARKLFCAGRPCRAVYLDNVFWYEQFLAAAKELDMLPGRDFHLLVFDSPDCDPDGQPPPGIGWMRQNIEGIDELINRWIASGGRMRLRAKLEAILKTGD